MSKFDAASALLMISPDPIRIFLIGRLYAIDASPRVLASSTKIRT
jgi:hypothetical protein